MTSIARRPPASVADWYRRAALIAACWLYFALFLFGHVLTVATGVGAEGGEGAAGGGNAINQLLAIAALLAAVYAARPWRNPQVLLIPVTLALALAWCWLSASWAIEPAISVRRVARLTIQALTGFLIARELGYDRTMGALRWAVGAALVASLIAVVLLPEVGIQQQYSMSEPDTVPRWRGIFPEKNAAGAFASIAILIFLFDAKAVRPWLRAAVVVAAAAMLWQSNSKTSMGVLAGALVVAFLLGHYNPRFRLMLVPLAIVAGAALALTWDDLLAPFQAALYDTTLLTGRGPIWATLIDFIRDHPWLGSGFGSFWAIGPSGPVYQYADATWVRESVYIGHNGFLDLWASIGLPGLLLALAATVVVPLVRLLIERGRRGGQIALLSAMILFFLGNNFTESNIFTLTSVLNDANLLTLALISVSATKVVRRRKGTVHAPVAR